MRCMRAEQIRYHFGRNFLSFCGMCCFNLIRYGTYQRRWKHSGDRWCIAGHPLSDPTSPQISTMSLPMVLVGHFVMILETRGLGLTVKLPLWPHCGTEMEPNQKAVSGKESRKWSPLKKFRWDKQYLQSNEGILMYFNINLLPCGVHDGGGG